MLMSIGIFELIIILFVVGIIVMPLTAAAIVLFLFFTNRWPGANRPQRSGMGEFNKEGPGVNGDVGSMDQESHASSISR
jgi:Sec-independent protein translocase protein TatA